MARQNQPSSPEMRQLQDDMEKLQDNMIDKIFRPLMKDAFSCAAKCCITAKSRDLNNCANDCQKKMPMMQQIVQQEMQTFQQRLQRCQMNCNEEAQDKVSMADMSMLSDSARDQLQNQVMQCNNKCFSQFRENSNLEIYSGLSEEKCENLLKNFFKGLR